MDMRALLLKWKADIDEALKSYPEIPVTPTTTVITTAAQLTAACLAGGIYELAPGNYLGNFRVVKPLTLTGPRSATLIPLDRLVPTVTILASDTTINGITVLNGAPDRDTIIVGSFDATSVGQQPAHVTLNSLAVTATTAGGHRGIALHGVDLAVKNCRVTGFWEAGRDSQAIWIHNGPGPYTITDNYLEASGETILVGGGSIKIPNCVPSDIVIARNVLFKPDTWRTNGATVKNAIELKIGDRVLIDGNTIDGNWRGGQAGPPILLTTRNQDGDTPWAIIRNVTISNNRTTRCPDGAAVSILGMDDRGAAYPSQQSTNISIHHNLFTDSSDGFWVVNGVLGEGLNISNNTIPAIKGNILKLSDSETDPARIRKTPLTFTANVVRSGAYGISGDNTSGVLGALTKHAGFVNFTQNVIEKTAERSLVFPGVNNTFVDPGGLPALLDPTTFKLKNGTAGY